MSAAAEVKVRNLVLLSIPAALIGALAALLLAGIDWVAEELHGFWWEIAPEALGVDGARWWPVVILTLTGLGVGLIVWKMPGHGGHDSATIELVAPVLPLSALPGVALALILGLAGGVSLGPESPIISIAVALSTMLMARLMPNVPAQTAMLLAAAGMVSAMFSSPFAAALLLSEILATSPGRAKLWDKMIPTLVSAVSAWWVGGLVGLRLMPSSIELGDVTWFDGLGGTVAALAAAGLGVAAAFGLPPLWRSMRRLGNPVLYITLGGLVLGLLGMLGGEITLGKGAHETGELLAHADEYAAWTLVSFALIKTVALVVSAASGFRGGRVFPAVFIGTSVGLAVAGLLGTDPGLAVAAGVLGAVLAISRDGWLALVMGALLVPVWGIVAILLAILIPTWLMITRAPEMIVHPDGEHDDDRPLLETPGTADEQRT